MKRWVLVVAALYFLVFVALTVPTTLLAFGPKLSSHEAFKVYRTWGYWILPAVMAISQVAFLTIPVRVASRRPVTRRALWPSLLAGGLMMAALAFGAGLSLIEFIFRDHTKDWMSWSALAVAGLTWCGWAILFYRLSRNVNASDLISKQCRWLLKGSILELLIAVPTHIVVRYRDYCCAGLMTFTGLALGISVMLFSFGPAVFFLFVDRWRRLHPDRLRSVEPVHQA
jgi:hypothetical protein